MKTLTLIAAVAFPVLSGCASTPGEGGAGSDGIAHDMLASVKEFRAGVHAVVGDVTGHRKRMLDAKLAKQKAEEIHRQTGLAASVIEEQGKGGAEEPGATQNATVPVLRSLEMEVREDEMIRADGSLHPSAAQALARMDGMVVEHGGDFAVYVPANQRRSVDEIRNVAPHAAIIEKSDAESFRLVVTPERG
jgi:hypothetical protein